MKPDIMPGMMTPDMLRNRSHTQVAIVCLLLFSFAASGSLAGSAKIRINVVDGQNAVVPDALLMFQMIEDPEQQFTVNQNDAGGYEATVQLAADESMWSVTKVLAPGFLPMKLDLKSLSAAGEAVQEVSGMDLDPSNPIPPIKILASGEVQIDLTLGDQVEVMQRFKAARAAAREAAKAKQEAAAPSGAYAEAVRLYNEGDYEGSLPQFQEALKERPDDSDLNATYAGALYKAKRFEEFEAAAQAALKQSPQNPNLLMMIYSSARGRGDLKTALRALLSARELGGGQDLLPHLTFVAQKMGHTAEALPAFEAILDLDPDNLAAVVGLASVHEMSGRSEKAQGYLDRAAKLAPGGAYKLYFGLATKLLDKSNATPEDAGRAIELLQTAVAIQPDSAEAQRKLGMAGWQHGKHAVAAAALQKYLMLKPDAEDRAKIAEYLNSHPD